MSEYPRNLIDLERKSPSLIDTEELSQLTLDVNEIYDSPEKFSKILEAIKNYEKYGTDCATFAFHMLRKMGLKHEIFKNESVLQYTSFPEKIKREDFGTWTEFNMALEKYVYCPSEVIDQKARQTYSEFWRRFTKSFLEMSKQQNLSVVSDAEEYTSIYEHMSELKIERQARYDKEVLDGLVQKLKQTNHFPQMLFVAFDNPDGTLLDVHSSMIVGPIGEGEDYWALERTGISEDVNLYPLSKVIHNYNKSGFPLRKRENPEAKITFCLVQNEQEVLDTVPSNL